MSISLAWFKQMFKTEKEKQLEALVKSANDKATKLEGQFEQFVEVMEKYIMAPKQRAVTSMADFMAKSELDKASNQPKPLNKSEIHAKLNKAARNPNTSSDDRDLINRYYSSGSIKGLEHILQDK